MADSEEPGTEHEQELSAQERSRLAFERMQAEATRQLAQADQEREQFFPPKETPPEPDYVMGFTRKTAKIPLSPSVSLPPEWSVKNRPTIDEARAQIEEAILDYLKIPNPQHILLIRAAPGLGKTTAGVLAAETAATNHQRVLYAGPRHAFFEDVLNIAQRPQWWYEWLPRQCGDDNGKCETCPYAEQIKSWLHRGHDALEFCAQICGWAFVNDGCNYLGQKKQREPIIFAMHEHVVLGHPLEFTVVIGDEDPVAKFAHPWRIPHRWILPIGLDPSDPFVQLVHELRSIAEDDQQLWGERLMTQLGGPELVHSAAAQYVEFWQPAPTIHDADDATEVDYRHLPDLGRLLYRESTEMMGGRECIWRVGIWNKALHLFLRNSPDTRMPPHVIWLDATANQTLYEACFKRPAQVLTLEPQGAGHIYQVYGRQYGKGSLFPKQEKKAEPVPNLGRISELEETMKRIIENKGYQDPAIISFKALPEAATLVEENAHGHFYAARGTNQFEDCDSLFVAGTPQPNASEIETLAKMIYFERDEPFDTTWCVQPKPHRYDDGEGNVWMTDTSGFWKDPALQAVLHSVREAELQQAAHRARPLHRDVDVWLITNLPTDLPIDGLFSLQDIFDTPLGRDVFDWDRFYKWALARGEVETKAAIAELGFHRTAIQKYMQVLKVDYEWEEVTVLRPPGTMGRPPKRLVAPP